MDLITLPHLFIISWESKPATATAPEWLGGIFGLLTQQAGIGLPYLDTRPPVTQLHLASLTNKIANMESFQSLGPNYVTAIKLIDEAHAGDPKTIPGDDGPVPYELHYARKMTRWLALREPDASPALQLACRAQHFRRYALPPVSPGMATGR
jgi:hypothetical protein